MTSSAYKIASVWKKEKQIDNFCQYENCHILTVTTKKTMEEFFHN